MVESLIGMLPGGPFVYLGFGVLCFALDFIANKWDDPSDYSGPVKYLLMAAHFGKRWLTPSLGRTLIEKFDSNPSKTAASKIGAKKAVKKFRGGKPVPSAYDVF
jgi:hypothetical protein